MRATRNSELYKQLAVESFITCCRIEQNRINSFPNRRNQVQFWSTSKKAKKYGWSVGKMKIVLFNS